MKKDYPTVLLSNNAYTNELTVGRPIRMTIFLIVSCTPHHRVPTRIELELPDDDLYVEEMITLIFLNLSGEQNKPSPSSTSICRECNNKNKLVVVFVALRVWQRSNKRKNLNVRVLLRNQMPNTPNSMQEQSIKTLINE